ncbi:hypothetical protein [Pleurocapsa sp. PCC 7319]|uniref:hypothetical protein n=1 Tax=Pleurocapsa sp. PCC 7319 TaxID=118161 RepID=UPI00034B4E71|nr:hypothetical protein [Pleurocapsa sp. PCC 7319]
MAFAYFLPRISNTKSSPPSPPNLGGTRSQSPPELGDLGGKNLKNETQETYVYTVAAELVGVRGAKKQHFQFDFQNS